MCGKGIMCEVMIITSMIVYFRSIMRKNKLYNLNSEIKMVSHIIIFKRLLFILQLLCNIGSLLYIFQGSEKYPAYIATILTINSIIWVILIAMLNMEHTRFGFSSLEFRKLLFLILIITHIQVSFYNLLYTPQILLLTYTTVMILIVAYFSFNINDFTKCQILQNQRDIIDSHFKDNGKDFIRNKQCTLPRSQQQIEAYEKAKKSIGDLNVEQLSEQLLEFNTHSSSDEKQSKLSAEKQTPSPQFVEINCSLNDEVQQSFLYATLSEIEGSLLLLATYSVGGQSKSATKDYVEVLRWVQRVQWSCPRETQERISELLILPLESSFDGTNSEPDYATMLIKQICGDRFLKNKFIRFLENQKQEDIGIMNSNNEVHKNVELREIQFNEGKSNFFIQFEILSKKLIYRMDSQILMKRLMIQQHLELNHQFQLMFNFKRIIESILDNFYSEQKIQNT